MSHDEHSEWVSEEEMRAHLMRTMLYGAHPGKGGKPAGGEECCGSEWSVDQRASRYRGADEDVE
jgi:hypothetical protein